MRGIGATGLVAALLVPSRRELGDAGPLVRGLSRTTDTLISGAVVAGSANLMNLFDLRPGRAIKVMLLFAPAAVAPEKAGNLVAVVCGAGAGLLEYDLAEKAMLGDTGANAAGVSSFFRTISFLHHVSPAVMTLCQQLQLPSAGLGSHVNGKACVYVRLRLQRSISQAFKPSQSA